MCLFYCYSAGIKITSAGLDGAPAVNTAVINNIQLSLTPVYFKSFIDNHF